jgi:hypothetical protein
MFAAESDARLVFPASIRGGMLLANVDDAGNASLGTIATNPQWAEQAMLTVMRLPKVTDTHALLEHAFVVESLPHQPTRQSLTDNIRLAAMAGRVSTTQMRWLADNKANPNRLWAAIGGISAKMAEDKDGQIGTAIHAHIRDLFPINDIIRFVLNWYPHAPDAFSAKLVTDLNELVKDTRNIGPRELGQLNARLIDAVETVAATLNTRLKPKNTINGNVLNAPFGFIEAIDSDHVMSLGTDIMEGVELPLAMEPVEGEAAYHHATKYGLYMIQTYLTPMVTPEDISEYSMMFLEEHIDDVNQINSHLERQGIEKTDDNIDQAITDLVTELCMVEDSAAYEYAAEQKAVYDNTQKDWQRPEDRSVAGFQAHINALPNPQSPKQTELKSWLNDLSNTLTNIDDDIQWWELLDETSDEDSVSHDLTRLTPVFLESETGILEILEEQHQFQMQGDECEQINLNWSADPATLLQWCDRTREGFDALVNLFDRLNIDQS